MTVVIIEETLLKKIVNILIELELFNSTILDGEAPETFAVEALPIFKELAGIIEEESVYNKTIICHVPDIKTIEKFVKICFEEGIDFEKEGIGWVMANKCCYFKGF